MIRFHEVEVTLEKSDAEFRIAYDLIRTLWLRYRAAKNTCDRLYAITQFIERAESFLERHGEFK